MSTPSPVPPALTHAVDGVDPRPTPAPTPILPVESVLEKGGPAVAPVAVLAAVANASAGASSLPVAAGGSVGSGDPWQEMVAQVAPAIVVMRVNLVRAFDGQGSTFQYATGFVVDAERGIILSNRHVVTTGPVNAEAVFLNHEEVPVVPIYRDPVHDFGFVAFNPADVRFMTVKEIPLAPEEAKIGTEIRVVGNDAGEKFQILSGTLARLDRPAPFYGSNEYNDFNTFYISAASSTTGGSSGSPVLNVKGQAVALNAGGKKQASSAFYLPLDRVVRALRLIQQGFCVPRGCLYAVFRHTPFDEVRRLGLQSQDEQAIRETWPEETGILTVSQVVQGGPAAACLEPGDILLSVNGHRCTSFVALEELLDNTLAVQQAHAASDRYLEGIPETIVRRVRQAAGVAAVPETDAKSEDALDALLPPGSVAFQRQFLSVPCIGTTPRVPRVLHGVEDLSRVVTFNPYATKISLPLIDPRASLQPAAEFTAVGDAAYRADGSSIAAREGQVEVRVQRGDKAMVFQMAVADLHHDIPWCLLEVSGGILHHVSHQAAKNCDIPAKGVYVAQLGYMLATADLPRNSVILSIANVPTPTLADVMRVLSGIPDMKRVPVRLFVYGDVHRQRVCVVQMDRKWFQMQLRIRDDFLGVWPAFEFPDRAASKAYEPSTTTFPPTSSRIDRSLVAVSFHIPFMIDGAHTSGFIGCGIVVSTEKGLLVTDRNTVVMSLGDVSITIAGSVQIPGKVVYLHPAHNIAVVQYDPALVGATALEAVTLSSEKIPLGTTLDFAGMSAYSTIVHQPCVVTKREALSIRDAAPPRYRAFNMDAYQFDRVVSCNGGVFTDTTGTLRAMWASFSTSSDNGEPKEVFRGIPGELIKEIVEPFLSESTPQLKWLGAEFKLVSLATARSAFGLSAARVAELEASDNPLRMVLSVRRSLPGSPAHSVLKEGDILLYIADRLVTNFRDIDLATTGADSVPVIILRANEEMTVTIGTLTVDSIGTDRVINWSGLMLHSSHEAVNMLGYVPPTGGVYCSRWSYGSPGHKYGLRATIWIVEVNGRVTSNLDEFLQVVAGIKHNENVRIKTLSLQGRANVVTLKTDLVYWPSFEIRRNDDGDWHLRAE